MLTERADRLSASPSPAGSISETLLQLLQLGGPPRLAAGPGRPAAGSLGLLVRALLKWPISDTQ